MATDLALAYNFSKCPIGLTLTQVSRFFMGKISSFIAKQKAVVINELDTDAINLFGLLTLVVDIRYRQRYGSPIEWDSAKKNKNTTLPGRLNSVDDGLEDVRQRRSADGK